MRLLVFEQLLLVMPGRSSARVARKPAKLAGNVRMRAIVQDDLRRRFSPEQIAGRLRRRFPEDPEM